MRPEGPADAHPGEDGGDSQALDGRRGAPALHLEMVLLAAFSAAWALAGLFGFGLLPLAVLNLDLHVLFGTAASLGWLAGNVYLLRRRRLDRAAAAVTRGNGSGRRRFRKRLLLVYLVGPPSIPYLLRALAPRAIQDAAPLVPLYSFLIFGIFFLVPLTLRTPTLRT